MSWIRNILIIIVFCCCIRAEAKGKDTPPQTASTLNEYYIDGRAALEDELFELAEKEFKAYLAADKISITNERYFEVGNLLMDSLYLQDKDQEIIKLAGELDKSWKKYGRSDELLYWTAVGRCELGEYDKALKLTDKFEKKYSKSQYAGKILRVKAWCSYKSGNIGDAIKYFSEYSEKYNNEPDSNLNL